MFETMTLGFQRNISKAWLPKRKMEMEDASEGWKNIEYVWRFNLRRCEVHNGSSLGSDDVAFSVKIRYEAQMKGVTLIAVLYC